MLPLDALLAASVSIQRYNSLITEGAGIMMRASRVIFRLDFLRNFKMINEPGTVARLIQESAATDFFDFFGEDRAARRVLVKRLLSTEVRYRSLTVEPTSIVCDVERRDGAPVETFADDGDFAPLCSIANVILKEFAITKLERAGLRVITFGTNGHGLESVVNACRSLISPVSLAAFEGVLGRANDFGISADGISDEKVGYHFRFGPFIGAEEYQKYFSNINELLPKDPKSDTVMDVDMYETKFTFTAANVVKWCVPQFSAAAKLAERIAAVVSNEAARK